MKLPDWEKRLYEYLEEQKEMPFKWGVNDCCQFAAKGAESQTGIRNGEEYQCSNAAQAIDILREEGGVIAIADKYYKRVEPNFVQRGDIVAANIDGKRIGLGIWVNMTGVFKGYTELLQAPRESILAAWRVE